MILKPKGYRYLRKKDLYQTLLNIRGKQYTIKAFQNEEEAEQAYNFACKILKEAPLYISVLSVVRRIKKGIAKGNHIGSEPVDRFETREDVIKSRQRDYYEDVEQEDIEREYYKLRTTKDEEGKPLVGYIPPYQLGNRYPPEPKMISWEVLQESLEDESSLEGINWEDLVDSESDPMLVLEAFEEVERRLDKGET